MTLSTNLYVLDKTDLEELFAKAIADLGGTELTEDREWYGARVRQTRPGQGLPAWLMVHYQPDGPLQPNVVPETEDEGRQTACYYRVNWDTGYGYDRNGEGCGQLHARLVASLGHWLDQRRISWAWSNEFTGDIYLGPAGLHTLAGGGTAAREWLANVVMPVITGRHP